MPKIKTKQRRTTQACDFCHARGMRCRQDVSQGALEQRSCATCVEHGETCTWNRAPKKRGTKPNSASGLKKVASWKQQILRERESISSLLDVYLDTVHPVFPLFCERELWVGWKEGTFPANPSQYASLICMCALSAQHAQQGSLFEDERPVRDPATDADAYLAEAVSLILAQQPDIFDIELVRSCGFLALLGLQTGNRSMIHKYLGTYHSVCAQFSLHDESHWEDIDDLSICELETRRRLYWAMYRLEVHSSCVLGHMIRLPEIQSNVNYPAGLHHPAFISGRDGDFEDWFAGWNTSTDLYRILEHTIVDFRASRRQHTNVEAQSQPIPDMNLQQRMLDIQQRALPQFDQVHEKSTDNGRNRCGFQTTNILFTIHMIRMFTSYPDPNRMYDAANALLESVKTIPVEYIRASGMRFSQELAGTGLMLGAIAGKSSTSRMEAQRLHSLQESLAMFLETGSSSGGTAVALAKRLRRQMEEVARRIAHVDTTPELDNGTDTQSLEQGWDDEIDNLIRFDHSSCATGITSVHFQPGFLVDFAWSPSSR